MRVLGIDPGTLKLGFGVVDREGDRLSLVECGVISLSSKIPIEERLHMLYTELDGIIGRYSPDEVAIEEPFVAKNARSALAIGRAQAVAIIAAIQRQCGVYRYMPTQVKQQVTDYGGSSKEQVQQMVKIHLNIGGRRLSSDAADALAIAICHLGQRHMNNLISGGSGV